LSPSFIWRVWGGIRRHPVRAEGDSLDSREA
jgi:hypothetical protein